MIFKHAHMKAQLEGCPAVLRELADYVDKLSVQTCGKEIVITRVTDTVDGESGVHPARRAFDARFHSSSGPYYTEEEASLIQEKVNERYPRTDGKITCLIHSFNGGMEHMHFQVPVFIPDNWP